LGASPDGFVEKIDSLVEIKCPYTAYKQNLTPDEAIMKKLIPFWKIKNDGNYEINTNHDWYYQISVIVVALKAELDPQDPPGQMTGTI
jgi:hypothetical protein